MAGHTIALMLRGSAFSLVIASTVFPTIPPTVPLHPAWAAATTWFSGSYMITGTQSAVLTPIIIPGMSVTRASWLSISIVAIFCRVRVCLTGHKKFVVSCGAPFGETVAALHEMCLPVACIMAQRESGIIIFPARFISTPCGRGQYAVFVGKCRYRNIPVLRITVLHAAKIALFWRRWPFGRLHITLKLANFAQKGYDGKGVF